MLALRRRRQRSMLASLLLSQGVPMLLGGDELGRTQQGNNNTYCQDNKLSWVDWDLDREGRSLLEFTRRLIELRRAHPIFRRRQFFSGEEDGAASDLMWLQPDGTEVPQEAWSAPTVQALMVFLNGEGIPSRDERGRPITDDSFLLLTNGSHEPVAFTLPPQEFGREWEVLIDTAAEDRRRRDARRQDLTAGDQLQVEGLGLMLLRREDES